MPSKDPHPRSNIEATAMAHIASITYRPATIELRPPDWYARIPVERTQLIPSHGIEGDTKGSTKDRQLNVMLAEAVERLREEGFKTPPGELGGQLFSAALPQAPCRLACKCAMGLRPLSKSAFRGRVAADSRIFKASRSRTPGE